MLVLRMYLFFVLFHYGASSFHSAGILKDIHRNERDVERAKCLVESISMNTPASTKSITMASAAKSSIGHSTYLLWNQFQQQIQQSYRFSIEILSAPCARNCSSVVEPSKLKHFILLAISDVESLVYILKNCLCHIWSTNTFFKIVLFGSENENNLSSILETLYNLNIFYGNLISLNLQENLQSKVKVFQLYTKCSSIHRIVQKEHPCDGKNVTLLRKRLDCPIKVGMRLKAPFIEFNNTSNNLVFKRQGGFYGFEYKLLLSVLDTPNPARTDTRDLGTYDAASNVATGLIQELIEKRIDIIAGAIPMNIDNDLFSFTRPFYYADYVAVIKKPTNDFPLGRLFHREAWIFLLVVFVSFAVVIVFVMLVVKPGRKIKDIIPLVCIDLFSILLGMESKIYSKNIRLIVINWIIFTFFLRCMLQVSSLNILLHFKTEQTLDNICYSNYTIYVDKDYDFFLKSGLSVGSCTIPSKNFNLCTLESPLHCLNGSDCENASAFVYSITYSALLVKFLDHQGESPFQMVQQRIFSEPLSFASNKGDQIVQELSKRLARLKQYGFLELFLDTQKYYVERTLERKYTASSFKKLSLKQLTSFFYMYGIGILLSSFVFVCELLYSHCSETKNS